MQCNDRLFELEPQLSGEDEVTTARRLLERIIAAYPRAFDVVLAEALYGTAPFFNFLLARSKHALVVSKTSAAICIKMPPGCGNGGSR